MSDVSIRANEVVRYEGSIVVLAGTFDNGKRAIFAADRRMAAPIIEHITDGHTPSCAVPKWVVLNVWDEPSVPEHNIT